MSRLRRQAARSAGCFCGPTGEAEAHGMLQIVDELGEDYLFPAAFFVPIEIPEAATHAFAGAA